MPRLVKTTRFAVHSVACRTEVLHSSGTVPLVRIYEGEGAEVVCFFFGD